MIKELAHFARVLPKTLRMKAKLDSLDLFEYVEQQLDEAGKAPLRAALVADLEGDVLEIGAGTGMMFPHYSRHVRLIATEPDEKALRRARGRAEQSAAQIQLHVAHGENLPLPAASVEAVVSANVLCCVRSVELTLAEVRRVLKPGGHLRLLEHVKSDRLVGGLLMDLFNPVWVAMNGAGCNMNRDAERALVAAGFTLVEVRRYQNYSDAFPAAFPSRWIRALRA